MRPSSSQSCAAIGAHACLAPSRRERSSRSGRGLLAVVADELLHAVGLLGALADPVFDARQIELQLRFALAGDRD